MTILIVLCATVALAGAITTVYAMVQTHVTLASQRDRVCTLEEKLQRLTGKIAANDRWSRDEIRDAVDQYLQTLDLEPSSGMGEETLLQMLMGMQQMGGTAPAPAPEETPGDGAPSDVEIAKMLAGKGGSINGT